MEKPDETYLSSYKGGTGLNSSIGVMKHEVDLMERLAYKIENMDLLDKSWLLAMIEGLEKRRK